jgi:hypothetical protein
MAIGAGELLGDGAVVNVDPGSPRAVAGAKPEDYDKHPGVAERAAPVKGPLEARGGVPDA